MHQVVGRQKIVVIYPDKESAFGLPDRPQPGMGETELHFPHDASGRMPPHQACIQRRRAGVVDDQKLPFIPW